MKFYRRWKHLAPQQSIFFLIIINVDGCLFLANSSRKKERKKKKHNMGQPAQNDAKDKVKERKKGMQHNK